MYVPPQLYTCAGAYEGAAKLYENLLLECPTYDKLPRVYMALGALYRRMGSYDKAFHYFLCVQQAVSLYVCW